MKRLRLDFHEIWEIYKLRLRISEELIEFWKVRVWLGVIRLGLGL